MNKVDHALIRQEISAAIVRSESPVKGAKLTLTNARRRLVRMTAPAWMTSGNSAASALSVCHFRFPFHFIVIYGIVYYWPGRPVRSR